MNRIRSNNPLLLTLMVGFVLTLGAGVVVGMAAGRHTTVPVVAPPPPHPGPGRNWLPEQLGLSPDQAEKVKAIWLDVQNSFQKDKERRAALVKERDGALLDLLTDEQKARYQKLMGQYDSKLNELNAESGREREKAFHDAVERTKLLLNDSQRQKYEQILKEHGHGERGEHGEHGGPQPGFGPGPHGDFGPRNRGGPRGERGEHSPWPGHGAPRPGEPRGDARGEAKTQPTQPAGGAP